MSDSVDLQHFAESQDAFGGIVQLVDRHQWGEPTPCTQWDVHALVNHLVGEQLWATPMLSGLTIDDVGSELDGDMLGAEPLGSWRTAAAAARVAYTAPGALDGTINSSSGKEPARKYLAEMTFDLIVHRWDLGESIGVPQRFSDAECQVLTDALAMFEPMAEQLVAAGLFGPPVSVSDRADSQHKILAALGRTA